MTVLTDLQAITALPAENASALPVRSFSDPALYSLEMDRIFRRDWMAVCAAAELSNPGDYRAFTLAGEPVLVLRGDDGALRALSNACTHRGTLLMDEGGGNATKMVCPYHAWTFKTNGELLGVPYPGKANIDKRERCLPQFLLEEWMGVVFINLDRNATPLGERLVGLDERLKDYGMDRYTIPFANGESSEWKANWKLVMLNAVESYHVFHVHPQTFEPTAPTSGAFYVDGSPRWSITAGAGNPHPRPPQGGPSRGDFEKGQYLVVAIPPSFVAVLTHDNWGWLTAYPVATDATRVASSSLIPKKGSLLTQVFADSYRKFVNEFFEEDRMICERGQYTAGATAAKVGGLVELERVVGDFHNYLGSRLFD